MNVDELVACAREYGFEDLAAIRRLARRAIVLMPGRRVESSSGGSRLGGLPLLPPSITWPTCGERSLSFVAQIDLASHATVGELGLPSTGLLLFFYDADQEAWGYEPADAGEFAVLHVPAGSEASAARWPEDLPRGARFPACGLSGEVSVWLPSWDSVLVEDLALADEQRYAYQDLTESTQGGDSFANRAVLGGHPDEIQGDVMLNCALVAAGFG